MTDPGWRGTWRYGLPRPKALERVFPSLVPPSLLAEYRGITIDASAGTAILSLVIAAIVASGGRIRIGEPGSGTVVLMVLLVLFGGFGMLPRTIRESKLDVTQPDSVVSVFWARCSIPQIAGLTLAGGALVLAELVGWWPAALIAAASSLTGAALGAPTAKRIGRIEGERRAAGLECDLLGLLLRPTQI